MSELGRDPTAEQAQRESASLIEQYLDRLPSQRKATPEQEAAAAEAQHAEDVQQFRKEVLIPTRDVLNQFMVSISVGLTYNDWLRLIGHLNHALTMAVQLAPPRPGADPPAGQGAEWGSEGREDRRVTFQSQAALPPASPTAGSEVGGPEGGAGESGGDKAAPTVPAG